MPKQVIVNDVLKSMLNMEIYTDFYATKCYQNQIIFTPILSTCKLRIANLYHSYKQDHLALKTSVTFEVLVAEE